jgi:SAM-dependent methyltransferase/FKBP-type peptidyl-prolyl cis-trans isomerase 2
MQSIDTHSRVTAEFTLAWRSSEALHTEHLWAHPVCFWRDVLDPALVKELKDKTVGSRAQITIPADRFAAPYRESKRILVRPNQFQGTDINGQTVTPVPGRFYPQGMLHGVGGVYQTTASPCRFLGQQEDKWLFDLNHPLAGRDLTLELEVLALHPEQKERGGRCEDWLERISSDGPGMQARFAGDTSGYFSQPNFQRDDERPDDHFYQESRLVHHLDSTARETICSRYGQLIPAGARVLDLMGSWDSHLPQELELSGLTVLGLNEAELRHNPRAGETLVQDLNIRPTLSFAENSFDAVLCTASIEYLTDPLTVMAEVRRVLRPGGLLAFAFSNRWFPPKAVRVWTEMHEFERMGWVSELILTTGGFCDLATFSRRGLPRPSDDPHRELWFSDPVFMVWGRKV